MTTQFIDQFTRELGIGAFSGRPPPDKPHAIDDVSAVSNALLAELKTLPRTPKELAAGAGSPQTALTEEGVRDLVRQLNWPNSTPVFPPGLTDDEREGYLLALRAWEVAAIIDLMMRAINADYGSTRYRLAWPPPYNWPSS
jgi:hypothetical protein